MVTATCMQQCIRTLRAQVRCWPTHAWGENCSRISSCPGASDCSGSKGWDRNVPLKIAVEHCKYAWGYSSSPGAIDINIRHNFSFIEQLDQKKGNFSVRGKLSRYRYLGNIFVLQAWGPVFNPRTHIKLGRYIFNPSTLEAETGGFLWLPSQQVLPSWLAPGEWQSLSQKIRWTVLEEPYSWLLLASTNVHTQREMNMYHHPQTHT